MARKKAVGSSGIAKNKVPLTGGTPRKKTKLLENTFAIENSFQLVRQKHERYCEDAFSANYPCQWQPLMNDVHQQ